MSDDRFPEADEVHGPLPALGPAFRRGVLAKVRQVRRRRRVAGALGGALLAGALAVALFPRASTFEPRAPASAPEAANHSHWNRALDEDLAWLEASQREASDNETTSTAAESEPLGYFFPDYQRARDTQAQLTLQ